MQPPVFFLIGSPRFGKTTAQQLLSEITHLKGGSCSEIVYAFLALRRGTSVEALRALPKEELRPTLIRAGDFMVGEAAKFEDEPRDNKEIDGELYRIPSALIRTLYMNGYNVIDGVRRRSELLHALDHLEWNGIRCLTLWIERPGAPIINDNTDLHQHDADEVVLNDGSLADLREKLLKVLEKHFGVQDELDKPVEIVDVPEKVTPPPAPSDT